MQLAIMEHLLSGVYTTLIQLLHVSIISKEGNIVLVVYVCVYICMQLLNRVTGTAQRVCCAMHTVAYSNV